MMVSKAAYKYLIKIFKYHLFKITASLHLSKSIELSRIHLFNIVTQYKAIFNDDDQHLPSGTKQVNVNKSYIFYGWLHKKVQ